MLCGTQVAPKHWYII